MYNQKNFLCYRNIFYYTSCTSTNDMAERYLLYVEEGTIFITDYQYKGKGKYGRTWISEEGKNLLFSVIIYPYWLTINYIFYLNIITSLAIYNVLINIFPKKITIRWPNDIYYLDKKLGGILIETNLGTKNKIKTAIIGIGLNINQLHFELPKVTSLAIHKGISFDRSLLLNNIMYELGKYYRQLQSGMSNLLWKNYTDIVYRK